MKPAALLLATLALAGPVRAAEDLPVATDLRAAAAAAATSGAPLVLMFSRNDCKYCIGVRRDYLKPLAASPAWRDRAVLRQINQDSDAPLVDFRGQPTTHARFAASEKVKLVPVVAFYGPGGHRLADPIVGARLPDFYQSYLEEAIVLSATQLRQR
jgi:thioredoxin-related protein